MPSAMSETAVPTLRRPLRVLFVLPDLDGGGAQRVTLSLLRQLDAARYAISLLVLNGPGALSPQVPPRVSLLYPPQIPGARVGQWSVLRHALTHDVLVAALELRTSFYVHFAAQLLRKPAILWVRIAFGEYAATMSERNRRLSRRAYRDIPNVVFVAEGARRSLAQWLGGEGSRWRTIHNLFDRSGYPAPASIAPQTSPTAPLLLGIGRLEARKGFDRLIDAFAQVVAAGRDARLVILGEGPMRGALEAQVRQLGLGDRIELPGFTPDPLSWMARATAYVLSSRNEGLPGTILEAMACGAPVIATDCPSGPREMLQDGEVGLLVPVDDPPALREAMLRVLDDPGLRQRLSRAGLLRIRAFEPARITAQWDALFAEVAGR